MKDCFIIGSAIHQAPNRKDVDIIAVNWEYKKYKDAKYLVSLDYVGFDGKEIEFNGTKVFVLSLHDYIKDGERVTDSRIDKHYNLSKYDIIIKSKRLDGIGTTFTDFRNNGNSGLSAFQFALLMGYKRIHLYGIEMKNDYRPFFEFMRKDLERFKELFPDVQVINHCKTSSFTEFFGHV